MIEIPMIFAARLLACSARSSSLSACSSSLWAAMAASLCSKVKFPASQSACICATSLLELQATNPLNAKSTSGNFIR